MNWRQWPARLWSALNAGGVAAVKIVVVALVAAFLYNYFHAGIVIKPMSVPSALREEGVTDAVAADQLRQRIYRIRQNASLNDNPKMPVALSAEQPDIDVPTTSISINTVFDILSSVLPLSPRTVITGDFTGDANQLRLVVLVNGREVYAGSRRPSLASADALIDEAAASVVTYTHPDWEAVALDHAGQTGEADRLMEGTIDRSGTGGQNVAEAHDLRGTFLREERKFPEACAEFKKSLEIDPGNPATHRDLAGLLEDMGQKDMAIAEARKAVVLSWGRDSWNYYALGTSYYSADKPDLDNARRAYERSIRLWFNNKFAHDALGLVMRSDHDYRGALAEFDTAIAIDNAFVDARDDRGTLLINKFRSSPELVEEAREDFALAHHAAPNDPAPDVGLAYVNYERRRYDGAVRYFIEALRRDPSLTVAYDGAISALQGEGWVARNPQVQKDLAILGGPRACTAGAAIPAEVAGQTVLRTLSSMRCAMERRRLDPVARSSKCQADSNRLSLLPSMVMFYSFGAVDGVQEHPQVVAPVLLIILGGFGLLGLRSRRRTITPNGRETVSDTDESTGPRGPEG